MRKTKYCPRCGEIKDSSEFYTNKCQPSGLSSYCKDCTRARARKLYSDGKIKPHKQSSEYYKQYYEKNKEKIMRTKSLYQKDNKEKVKEWHKKYRETHREQIREASKRYRTEHKAEIAQKAIDRLRNDPLHKERERCRASIRGAWKTEKHRDESPIKELLGCNLFFFKEYLLKTWKDRYGSDWSGEKCEIDHIIPLAKGKTIEEIRELCNYKNLQLLTPEDDAKKHIS